MYFLTVSKMWFAKRLRRDFYSKYLVIAPFSPVITRFCMFHTYKNLTEGQGLGCMFCCQRAFHHRAIQKNRCASGPEKLSKSVRSFQDLHCLYLSHTSECLCACSFSYFFSCHRKQAKPPGKMYSSQLSGQEAEAERLLWDWNQPRPHSEFPASPECRVWMYLNIQTKELKDVWNKL